MKLPALLAIGFLIVFSLAVYFLNRPDMSPAFLLYPAAWAIVGLLFFGLNAMLNKSSQPSSDTPRQGISTKGDQPPETSSDSSEPAMTS